MARNGMVVTPHYLASQAGLQVLQEGGNAVEAAIAVAAALSVVYPHANGIGGDNFWLIFNAHTSELRALNASGRSGRNATQAYYLERGFERIPARGFAAANTVPGAVSGWDQALRYALEAMPSQARDRSWKRLLSAAIGYAADGFPVSANQALHGRAGFTEKDYGRTDERQFDAYKKIFCGVNGMPPACGSILVQADLAKTLEHLSERGLDAFYHGEIAARIVKGIAKYDGVLTLEDFHNHTANWVAPVHVPYRGFEAFNLPPNTQGMAALGCLNILNNFDLSQIAEGSAQYYHLMAEVTKEAFADRDRWLTDPDFLPIPVAELLSAAHGKAQAERILSRDHAAPSQSAVAGGDTVWIGVMDRWGNAVSLIQSICDGFGSGAIPEGTGVVLQNRGKYFTLNDDAPNKLMPNKRSFHTLIAGILMDNGRPALVYGTMGGEGQPQTQTAIVTRIVDYGFSPQAAIEAPRWLQGRFLDLTQPATHLNLEARIPEAVVAELRRLGHSVLMTANFSDVMGHAGAIFLDTVNGVMHGGADPRGDGAAVGF